MTDSVRRDRQAVFVGHVATVSNEVCFMVRAPTSIFHMTVWRLLFSKDTSSDLLCTIWLDYVVYCQTVQPRKWQVTKSPKLITDWNTYEGSFFKILPPLSRTFLWQSDRLWFTFCPTFPTSQTFFLFLVFLAAQANSLKPNFRQLKKKKLYRYEYVVQPDSCCITRQMIFFRKKLSFRQSRSTPPPGIYYAQDWVYW